MACFELPSRFGFRFENLIISHGISVTRTCNLSCQVQESFRHYTPNSSEVNEHLQIAKITRHLLVKLASIERQP
jgi:hypothetical protein